MGTHRHHRQWIGACLALCGIGACGPDAPAAIEGVSGARYAVASTDYTVSSVGLLDRDGKVLTPRFVHSGSATAGLVTALSGDIALPTRSGEHGVLTIIDRYRTDVVTRIDLDSGEVLGQVKTQAANGKGDNAFSSNPYDYAQVDDSTAWVSRYGINPSAPDGDADQGVDLLRIDPTRFVRTDQRIDFGQFNGKAQRTNDDTGEIESVVVYARPGRIVRLGKRYLVVGIESLSQTFDAAGEGMVALVDLEKQTARKFRVPGLQSCGDVVPVPDDDTRVAVACSGVYFGDADAPSTAGLAMLALDGDQLVIEHQWFAAANLGARVTRYGLIALDADNVIAFAAGEKERRDADGNVEKKMTHDALYRVDMASGVQHRLFEADGRYVLGTGVFDVRGDFLLVPDASIDDDGKPTAGIRRFERGTDGEFEAVSVVEVDELLPPREIKPLE